MLGGLTIIDASSVLAGPSVATYFSELGAKVIKVEHPLSKDVTRSWKLVSENPSSTISAYFCSINYRKEYLSLDLKKEKDLDSFNKLISSADILISNFKRGDDIKFGVQDEKLFALNDRLIIGKINGYGEDSDRAAYDLVLQAETGFMSMNGTAESGPVKMPVALIDVLAAHHLKEAILLALYDREKTGKGKSVSVSLYDAAVSSLVNQASNYLMAGHVPERIGSLHPNIAPYGELFQTADRAIITFAIGSNTHFEKLCVYLGLDQLASEADYASNQSRVNNRVQLKAFLQEKIYELNSDDVINAMIELNVPAGKVKNLEEVFQDPKAIELVREEIIDGHHTKRITSVIWK